MQSLVLPCHGTAANIKLNLKNIAIPRPVLWFILILETQKLQMLVGCGSGFSGHTFWVHLDFLAILVQLYISGRANPECVIAHSPTIDGLLLWHHWLRLRLWLGISSEGFICFPMSYPCDSSYVYVYFNYILLCNILNTKVINN